MARASTPTLLSLDRFARILGVNPVHFNGGAGDPVWPRAGQCDETWVQHPWQTMRTISREELAMEIRGSEDTIARYLGFDVEQGQTYFWWASCTHSHRCGQRASIQRSRWRWL